MNGKYLYLFVDLGAISIPFLASFYPKAPFYKKWKSLVRGLLLMFLIFLPWDILYTRLGVWAFNERYVSGIHLAGLPLEEWLFFICIPYACMFTYFALEHLVSKDYLQSYVWKINTVLIFALFITGLIFMDRIYTSATFFLLAGSLTYHQLMHTSWLSRFYLMYAIILIPFFIVNGILTGSWIEGEVVWYNGYENMGIRMGTIPVEDVFYGMLMMLLVTWGYKYSERSISRI